VTFEELRIAKSDDFPELGEGKKVSWSVEYGKTVKMIADPKSTTIASVKEEIERSKAFLDGLKKAKEKSPDCLVKPRVTAQSKGIAAYKGVFPSREDAEASDKRICLFPARDGQVYELRKTEMGDFIAPKSNVVELSEVKAGFIPALPPIPWTLLGRIVSFFRYFMNEDEEFEALAHIYWDRENACFEAFIPNQLVGKARVSVDLRGSALPEERYLHYADIHSHNSMAAKFSFMDDEDERPRACISSSGGWTGTFQQYRPAFPAVRVSGDRSRPRHRGVRRGLPPRVAGQRYKTAVPACPRTAFAGGFRGGMCMKFSRTRPVKIVQLGAGGTGGHAAPHLYRLLYALDRPVRYIICDGDVVEEKNLVRQNFTPADLGENKAKVLAERYSMVFGMERNHPLPLSKPRTGFVSYSRRSSGIPAITAGR
jgi:hypothetical protein